MTTTKPVPGPLPSDFTVLIVDDERNIRRSLRMVLDAEGYRVLDASTAEEGLGLLSTEGADCVLLDVKLPGMDGVEALKQIKSAEQCDPDIPVIMISGHATVSDAVQATRLGAYDFFEKPLDRNRILVSLRNALAHRRMEVEVRKIRAHEEERFQMVGKSPVMQELFRQIEKVAPTKGRVLITGESGTGKELVARAIHANSQLASGPFVKVNCAAIPPELIESELFGHEKGAFTGAVGQKKGLFEVATSGSILLDEVGDMSLAAQAKVLRVLQSGEIVRVGGERVIHVDVRVIAATNKDLQQEVAAGRFREDLYFRLNVIPLQSPPLRDRLEDIPALTERFVMEFCKENGFKKKWFSPEVLQALGRHHWPGNVRELKNLCERLVILSDEVITASDLPDYLTGPRKGQVNLARHSQQSLREFREEMERAFLQLKLEECDWNISRAATALGIERTNLHKKIKAYGLKRQDG